MKKQKTVYKRPNALLHGVAGPTGHYNPHGARRIRKAINRRRLAEWAEGCPKGRFVVQ